MPAVKVTVKNSGSFWIKPGTMLIDALTRKGYPVNAVCNGKGRCGLCRVKVLFPGKQADEIESSIIPRNLQEGGYRLTCRYRVYKNTTVVLPQKLKKLRPGKKALAMALDIGTTVIKGAAMDLKTGRVLHQASVYNLQSSRGGDVITRVGAAMEGDYGTMQHLLRKSIKNLTDAIGISKPLFTTVVGNPVMLSFYLDRPVDGFASAPFQGPVKNSVHLQDPPRYVFPVIGGFVGGDALAGILASNITRSRKAILYYDLGTNGEVIISTGRALIATSTAAGPAFEGVGISCGSLAIPGAINRVTFRNGKFQITTIENKKPIGLCASGLIDLLYCARKYGFLRDDGKVLKPIKTGHYELTQEDVRKLQLAVGALHTGIKMLASKAGLRHQQIDRAVITGEFGAHLRITALHEIGLLPRRIKKVSFRQGLPLKGALMALSSDKHIAAVEILQKKFRHLELAREPEFQKEFIHSLRFAPWD